MVEHRAPSGLSSRARFGAARLAETFAGILVIFVAAGSVIGPFSALGMLIFGIAIFALRPLSSMSFLMRYWFILAIPFYFGASALWSLHPTESLRGAVQLMATVIFAILVVQNLSIRDMRFVILCTLLCTTLISIALGNPDPYTGAYKGLYGSKNALAVASAELTIAAVLTVLDKGEGHRRKLFALCSLPIAMLSLIFAQSAGTWILLPLTLMIVGVGFVFSRLSPMSRVVHGLFYLLCLITLIALLISFADDVIQFVLMTLQKDITLTGRTLLWNEAIKLIEERPWLGHGYKGFWVQDYGPAETLWREFGSERRNGFHFHNLYLSNAVEVGIVGVAMQVMVLYGAFLVTFVLAIREKSAPYMFVSAFCAMSILQSAIEVPIMYQFNFRTTLMISALVFGLEGLKPGRIEQKRTARSHAKSGECARYPFKMSKART